MDINWLKNGANFVLKAPLLYTDCGTCASLVFCLLVVAQIQEQLIIFLIDSRATGDTVA